MAYCRKCGAVIDDEAVICPKCGVQQKELGTSQKIEYDDVSDGNPVISAFFPLIGLILGLVYSSNYKRKAARQCFKGAAIGVAIGFLLVFMILAM